jgi:lactococcin 972 family bacteriocin
MRRKISRKIIGLAFILTLAGAAPAYATVVNVGGGTWNYGVNYNWTNKAVYSQYVHNTSYHSATSICGSAVDKKFANARYWAYSGASCGLFDSTAAYWATY